MMRGSGALRRAACLAACMILCVPASIAQMNDVDAGDFDDQVVQAAERGATDDLRALIADYRLDVKPIVEALLKESFQAARLGDEAASTARREAARAVADAFAAEFGESSLLNAVEDAARWSMAEQRRKLVADSLYAEGTALRGKKETRDQAYDMYLKALAEYRGLGDRLGLASVLGGLGVIHWYAGNADSTRIYFQRALEARQAVDDRQLVGNSFNDLGSASRLFFDDYETSLAYYLKAEAVRREIGDDEALGKTLPYIAYVYEVLGDREKALTYYEQAADVNRGVGDVGRTADALTYAGVVLKDLGRYSEALERLEAARALLAAHEKDVTDVLNWIGVVHRWLGDYESALSNYQEVTRLAGASGDDAALAHAYSNIGVVYLSADRPERAADYFSRALEKFNAVGDEAGALAATLNLASSLFEQDLYAEAEPYLHEALAAARSLQDQVTEARALILFGNVMSHSDRLEEAVQRHKEGLEMGKALAVPDLIWSAHLGLGDDLERLGRYEEVVRHYDAAFETLEDVRGSLRTEEEKANYLAQQRYAFEEVITSMSRMHESAPEDGYDEIAFRYAEQAKARAFLDLLAEALSNVREGVDSELLSRQKNLLAERSRVQQELTSADLAEATRDELEQAADSLNGAYRVLQRDMVRLNPRYSALQYPTPVSLDDVRENVLDDDVVLLEYAIADTSTALWVVTRHGRTFHRLPGRAEIDEQIELIRFALSNPDQGTPAQFAATARRLYELLLEPAEASFAEGSRLVIVPDGPLYYLPFEVLLPEDPAETAGYASLPYLVRSHAVSYAQSAGVLKQLRNERRPHGARRQLLAFGDPAYDAESGLERLAYSGTEVEGIASLFASADSDVYLRDEASERNLKSSALEGYRYIHFATHGLIDEKRPDFSSVALAGTEGEDGLLQAAEIFNLRMNADLIVLSACQTGLGKMVRGEGMVGLTRAFMYAGAPSLVVSLWRVADLSTARLMEAFYNELVTNERNKTDALRQAKLALLAEGELAHPFLWAPFILIGDWE